MTSKRTPSVSGLANIGVLLQGQSNYAKPAPAARSHNLQGIALHTARKLLDADQSEHARLVSAAVKEAYNAGHAEGLAQGSAVETLLNAQYDSRTRMLVPTVVAAIMDQLGMQEMTLDLNAVSTTFKRVALNFSLSDAGVVEYKLTPIEEVVQ